MLGSGKAITNGLFEHHLITRKQKKGKRKKVLVATLMLTSMVDMFSMLVVFLLQTFSSSPEILVTKGLKLPDAVTGQEVKEAPVLSMTKDNEVFLDQKLIGKTENIFKNPMTLVSKLKKLKTTWVKAHPGQEFTGDINLQADENLESVEVSRMMGLLTTQQFSVIQMAIVGGGNLQ